jgi:hypothetical protein
VNMKEEVYEIGGLAMGQVLGQVLLSHVRGGPLETYIQTSSTNGELVVQNLSGDEKESVSASVAISVDEHFFSLFINLRRIVSDRVMSECIIFHLNI